MVPTLPSPAIPAAAAVPFLAGQDEETFNLNANLAIAANILKDTPDDQVSDEPVNPDWFARWRREACLIGEPEMRVLWGRILAEEVKQPHTISLKTLDILKNITSDDARLFCKIVRFRIATLIPIEPSPLGDYDLANILTLEDLNLMRFDLSLTTGVARTSEDDGYLIPCNGFVFFISGDSEPEIKRLSGAILTGAAEEIIKIADTIPPATDEEIKTIGDAIWSNISSQNMVAYPIVEINRSGSYRFDKSKPLRRWER